MGKFIDMTGWIMSEHGVPDSRLTVVKQDGYYVYPNGRVEPKWLCRCNCGDNNFCTSRGSHIRNGNTKSCGCLQREKSSSSNKTHQESKTRLYRIWCNMKTRCYNQNASEYERYGGRGISICDDWVNNYESFKDWAYANGYDDNLTIERKDVNGNYCPENCTWATILEQMNNMTTNHLLTFKNETHNMKQWANIIGISYTTMKTCINKRKWSIEDVIEHYKSNKNKILKV